MNAHKVYMQQNVDGLDKQLGLLSKRTKADEVSASLKVVQLHYLLFTSQSMIFSHVMPQDVKAI